MIEMSPVEEKMREKTADNANAGKETIETGRKKIQSHSIARQGKYTSLTPRRRRHDACFPATLEVLGR